MAVEHLYQNQGIKLKYYEIKNDFQPLVLIHAQRVDGKSFANVWKRPCSPSIQKVSKVFKTLSMTAMIVSFLWAASGLIDSVPAGT